MPTRPPPVWNPVDKLDPGGQASAHRPTAWILVFRRSIPLDVKFGLSREETFDAAVTGCTRAYVWWWSSFVVLQFQRTARLNRIGPRPTIFFLRRFLGALDMLGLRTETLVLAVTAEPKPEGDWGIDRTVVTGKYDQSQDKQYTSCLSSISFTTVPKGK